MSLPNEPITRNEQYLSNIAGQGTALPPDGPQTREESYLDYIANHGGGGEKWDFSTTEFDTGKKWIDGKTIYGRVLDNQSIKVPGGPTFGTVDLSSWNIDTPVFCYTTVPENGFVFPMVSDSTSNQYGVKFTSTEYGLRKPSSGGSVTLTFRIIFFYTKSASE